MIYLASPYSHPVPETRTRRYIQARDFTHYHLQQGVTIFSPIVYGHQFSRDLDAPTDAKSWLTFNSDMMQVAREMWVLTIPGWEESLGIKAEIEFANFITLDWKLVEPL